MVVLDDVDGAMLDPGTSLVLITVLKEVAAAKATTERLRSFMITSRSIGLAAGCHVLITNI